MFREVRFASGDEFPPDERVPLAVVVNSISKPRVRECASLGSSRTMFASLLYYIARLAQTLDPTRDALDWAALDDTERDFLLRSLALM